MLVKSFTGNNLHEHAKAGLMIRDSHHAPNSRYFSLFVKGGGGVQAQYRLIDGDETDISRQAKDVPNSNIWLKIKMTGNEFQAYYKTSTATSWSTLGSAHHDNFGSQSDFTHGIAVSSTVEGRTATIKCSNWTATRSSPSTKVRFLILFHLAFSLFSLL